MLKMPFKTKKDSDILHVLISFYKAVKNLNDIVRN